MHTQRPTVICFDMDDTLIDGIGAATAAWDIVCADAAARLGCDATVLRDAIRREGSIFWKDEAAVGHWRLDLEGAREIFVRTALEAESLDPTLAHHISHEYARLHRENLRIFDDTIEVLEGVRAAGYATAMITNGPRPLQRDKIERFGFAPYFDLIVIEGEFGHGKPHRAVFEHAVATFGVEPARAWHIGDNLYADISGAQAVGLHATWIHRDRLKLDPHPVATPDRAIATLRDLHEPLGL